MIISVVKCLYNISQIYIIMIKLYAIYVIVLNTFNLY